MRCRSASESRPRSKQPSPAPSGAARAAAAGRGDPRRGLPRRRAGPAAALLSVAEACGDDRPHLSDAAAAAIELIHCASLVHDDMPCFDDAPLRRGKPSVHRLHGEPLALLAGDTLIVLAFETLARAGAARCRSARRADRSTSPPSPACRAASAPARAGRASRTSTSPPITRPRPARSSSPPPDGRGRRRRRPRALDRARRPHRRGLPGGRRPARRALRRGRPRQAGRPGRRPAPAERRRRPRGLRARSRRLQDILAGAISSIPACPGEAALCADRPRPGRAADAGRRGPPMS